MYLAPIKILLGGFENCSFDGAKHERKIGYPAMPKTVKQRLYIPLNLSGGR